MTDNLIEPQYLATLSIILNEALTNSGQNIGRSIFIQPRIRYRLRQIEKSPKILHHKLIILPGHKTAVVIHSKKSQPGIVDADDNVQRAIIGRGTFSAPRVSAAVLQKNTRTGEWQVCENQIHIIKIIETSKSIKV